MDLTGAPDKIGEFTRGDFGASKTYSPSKAEVTHMKPSNMFEDITEQEFNKREAEKKQY